VARWWPCRWCCRPPCWAFTCCWPWGRTVRWGSSPALGIGPLPFTFWGLVIASVFYSLPFMVQPLQTAFESIGERPLEVAATLRASPLDAFLHRGRAAGAARFLTASILTFAHTVGEFGVVLMIGGNIPGVTRVASVQIYDHVEALEYLQAHRLSAVMLVSSPSWCCWRCMPGGPGSPVRKGPEMGGIQARFQARLAGLHARCGPGPARARRHRAVRPLRLGQDHAAALHRRAGARPQGPPGGQRRGVAGRPALAAHAPAPAGLCVPGGQPVPAPHGAGQSALRPEAHVAARSPRAWTQAIELLGIGPCWSASPTGCRAANASASAWHGRWPCARACC
jgi:hypothetical protein